MINRYKVDQALESALSLFMVVMVLNVLWQIASRYILNDPSAFTDELSRYLLIWVGLLGAAYATGKDMHVSIELLERKLSEENKRIQKIVIKSLVLIFSILVLLIGGIRLVYISFQLGQASSAMNLSLGYVYMALPISGLLICYYTSSDLFTLIKKK